MNLEVGADLETGGSAHTIAYDLFTQRPEGAEQLMAVLSDTGIPQHERTDPWYVKRANGSVEILATLPGMAPTPIDL